MKLSSDVIAYFSSTFVKLTALQLPLNFKPFLSQSEILFPPFLVLSFILRVTDNKIYTLINQEEYLRIKVPRSSVARPSPCCDSLYSYPDANCELQLISDISSIAFQYFMQSSK